ncbi:MAG: tRNA (adenosine(37)-N6)-threonylcarbamoyltransferase complex dimerization subunit type 1 TsaB [Polyangiaceae bacterium]|nr:tRNA (adenosine(37)-N6)-threonylcarbamoyltransferase complex dimerization subunit type 1 TsaB [Polyangiaceae bacterium]
MALAEDGRLVCRRAHEEPNAHAERLLALIEELMGEAGWTAASVERVGVGIGPGSFTGVRVGMALAQGIALGLGVPVVGVPSLAAMARAVPPDIAGRRLACLDARRGEIFIGLFESTLTSPRPPGVLPRDDLPTLVEKLLSDGPLVVVGEVASELGILPPLPQAAKPPARLLRYDAEDAELPDARWIADLAAIDPAMETAAEPLYVREPDAVRPAVPPDALLGDLALGSGAKDGSGER